jgi:hypothetical protein
MNVLLVLALAAPADDAARAVLADLVSAAKANHASARPKKGSELTALLVRAAAASARKQPKAHQAHAFLRAIGVGLDTSALMRSNPVTALAWRRVETDAERTARLKVLGTPELHGRHDLAQHFAVSCALTSVFGEKAAEAAGILKETLDARPGGSGFSFADLAADFSGVAFAAWVIKMPSRLDHVKGLEAFCVPPKGLEEGLSQKQFAAKYGDGKDERFLTACRKLRERIAALPVYREKK